jgi:hypothetical protein
MGRMSAAIKGDGDMASLGVKKGSFSQHGPFVLLEVLVPRIKILRGAWARRQERLWIGLVAIPLAELAAALLGLWWAWPVLLLYAWACTPRWNWSWLLPLELGLVGLMCAEVGAQALAYFSGNRLIVGALWSGFPLAQAGSGRKGRGS